MVIIDLGGGWKADLIICKDRPFSRREFDRRRQIDVKGYVLSVAAPEDIILSKLEWMKERESDIQYSDALGVAVAQWDKLDIEYRREWARQLGVEDKLIYLLEDAREQAERTE